MISGERAWSGKGRWQDFVNSDGLGLHKTLGILASEVGLSCSWYCGFCSALNLYANEAIRHARGTGRLENK
jgi:hypothetical protein